VLITAQSFYYPEQAAVVGTASSCWPHGLESINWARAVLSSRGWTERHLRRGIRAMWQQGPESRLTTTAIDWWKFTGWAKTGTQRKTCDFSVMVWMLPRYRKGRNWSYKGSPSL